MDPYLYEGTDVLKNLLNIKDHDILNEVEKQLSTIRIKNILDDEKTCIYNEEFNFETYKLYHKYIFQDIYEWAGQVRTINIEKSEIALNGIVFRYSTINNIKSEIISALSIINNTEFIRINKDKAADIITFSLSDVWKAHAFREGNTRATVMFFINMTKKLGIPLDSNILTENSDYLRRALVAASYEDSEIGINRNYKYLKNIIYDSMDYQLKRDLHYVIDSTIQYKINNINNEKQKSEKKDNNIR